LKDNYDPQIFKDMLKSKENVHYLEHEGIEVMGYKFFGTPYVPVFG